MRISFSHKQGIRSAFLSFQTSCSPPTLEPKGQSYFCLCPPPNRQEFTDSQTPPQSPTQILQVLLLFFLFVINMLIWKLYRHYCLTSSTVHVLVTHAIKLDTQKYSGKAHEKLYSTLCHQKLVSSPTEVPPGPGKYTETRSKDDKKFL